MPSSVDWIEQPWIMTANYSGRLTVDDFDRVMKTCLAVLEKQRLYFLVDLSQVTSYPLSVGLIPSLVSLVHHPNTACFAWVGASRFARAGIPPFVRKPNQFFDSREQAIEYLYERMVADRLDTMPASPPGIVVNR